MSFIGNGELITAGIRDDRGQRFPILADYREDFQEIDYADLALGVSLESVLY